MAAEGDPVREGGLRAAHERLDRPLARRDASGWGEGGRAPLGEHDHVGLDLVARRAEPLADAPEAADDLVGDEEDAVCVADVPDALEVTGRRRDRARRV